ncbi:MAG: hypothetical protein ABH846_04010 [Patescibacteria group bacterium]
MILRAINFGPVWGASGVQNFTGEGYPFHHIAHLFGLDFTGMTFVAKTTTLYQREGNMPLRGTSTTPQELLPRCIWVGDWKNLWRGFRKGMVLNSVGLTGPGAHTLLNKGEWGISGKPFFISFMSVAETKRERLDELKGFVRLVASYMQYNCIRAPFGIQLNYSCPNVGVAHNDKLTEIEEAVKILNELSVPIAVKLSLTTSVEDMIKIASIDGVDCLVITNTIPFGQLPDEINWNRLFHTEVSPLYARDSKFGVGGLSGKPLFTPLIKRCRDLRAAGWWGQLNAGGGVWYPEHVDMLFNSGVNGISIGSVAMLRPWRVQEIIRRAHELKFTGRP